MNSIRKVQLPLSEFDELVAEASVQGFKFLSTMQAEWDVGENRFSGDGEAFYGVFVQEKLVAVGGLNRDPFVNAPTIGRLRRIYVRAAWRRRGIGAALVAAMLSDARQSFHTVRLRADNPGAARLYERFGFQPCSDPGATHVLRFSPEEPDRENPPV
jgi:GNAT superfamily N-acetyltransferase